ncbi:hypothetical protein HPB49_008213 [Dermacentor silvarum]|uniref:Uncharacterized protein n=1 Tax=Dermacentor silvarum TaxID=543639 RepID=A0ACB8DI44_DERSI|nr:hypothetical protein HPB49_008213 [Dermacentor silvarum]
MAAGLTHLELSKAEVEQDDALLRAAYKAALGLPTETPTDQLLALEIYSTFGELRAAVLISQRERLSDTHGLSRIFLLLILMDAEKKRDFRSRKYRTKHKFKGTRRKVKRLATETSAVAKPNLGDDAAFDGSEPARRSRFIDSVDEFVSTSQKKLKIFENEDRSGEEMASTFICEIGIVNLLVSAAACPACELSIRELPEKRKGLASFLELRCSNAACFTSIVSSTYSSRRAAPADDANGGATLQSGQERVLP